MLLSLFFFILASMGVELWETRQPGGGGAWCVLGTLLSAYGWVGGGVVVVIDRGAESVYRRMRTHGIGRA